MKKVLGTICIAVLFMVGCSSFGNPKKMACRTGCDSEYDSCMEKAKDNKKKTADAKSIAACEAKKMACMKGCDEL